MAYTITLSNGTILPASPIEDNSVDTSTSLVLIGRNYAGYGQHIAEDFIHLLENFAHDRDHHPATPLTGQLFWNTTRSALEVWNGTAWVSAGIPADGVINQTDITIQGHSGTGPPYGALILENFDAPVNQRKWRIRVGGPTDGPFGPNDVSGLYNGMLLFEALNDDGSWRITVMKLDSVLNLIKGVATGSLYSSSETP